MNETFYYRSEHPQVREFLTEAERLLAEYRRQVTALEAEFPGYVLIETSLKTGARWIAGLQGKDAPGPLWTMKRGDSYWSPNRSTKAGKELYQRLRAVEFPCPRIPGMPVDFFDPANHRICYPGFEQIDGVFWVFWGVDVTGDPEFDATIWTPTQASRYWLVRETMDAASCEAGATQ